MGVRSDLVVNYSTWLQYPADRCLGQWLDSSWATRARRLCFALAAPWRYDVFHYYFGESFFHRGGGVEPSRRWFADLRLANVPGRRVLMTLQGCDVRLSQRSAARNEITMCHLGLCQSAAACRNGQDRVKQIFLDHVLPLAERVFVLNPELVHDVPRAEFLPYACVDVEAIAPAPPRTEGPITLLHAPSNAAKKGTRFVREAVERLQRRHEIRYVEITRAPHAEAMKLYAQADLVIDQLLAGWYGGFAVEAMAMGKPVVCYIRGGPAIRAAGDGRRVAVDSRASRLAGGRPGGGDCAAVRMARLGPPRTGIRPPLAPSAADRRSDDGHLSRSAGRRCDWKATRLIGRPLSPGEG